MTANELSSEPGKPYVLTPPGALIQGLKSVLTPVEHGKMS